MLYASIYIQVDSMDPKIILGNKLYLSIILIVAAAAIIGIYMATNNASPIVANGDTVDVFYTGTFTNGTVFDSNVGGQPLQFTVGSGQVIPGFDQAVLGMKIKESKTVTIPANDAYGPVNPSLIIEVPLAKFGNASSQIKVGSTVTQQSTSGQQIPGVVTAVSGENATIDFNSPLAGKTLIFNITIENITKS